MQIYIEQLLNIALRSATLGTRFIFIFFLAKYLDPGSVGYYGIFTATIGYCLYFVGLDFYTFVTREILKAPKYQRAQMLKGQIALSGLLYVLLFPMLIIFLAQVEWPGYLPWWFIPILVLEHFNQEISRLLVTLSEQITASVLLFVRQGGWAIASVILMSLHSPSRNLDTVMALWVIFGIVAASLGIYKVNNLKLGGWYKAIDWKWIKKGITISIIFLIGSLAMRGITTFDRYWLQDLGGIEIVGVYVLFIGIASTLSAFLDAGIFAYAYPVLIKLYHNHDYEKAREKLKQVVKQTIVLSIIFAFASWIVLPYLLNWIGNSVYIDSIDLYPWLLLVNILYALGMVPHYSLYAQDQDKHIIYSQITALVVFIGLIWMLNERYGYMSVLISLNISYGVILIWKSIICNYFIVKAKNNKKNHVH